MGVLIRGVFGVDLSDFLCGTEGIVELSGFWCVELRVFGLELRGELN